MKYLWLLFLCGCATSNGPKISEPNPVVHTIPSDEEATRMRQIPIGPKQAEALRTYLRKLGVPLVKSADGRTSFRTAYDLACQLKMELNGPAGTVCSYFTEPPKAKKRREKIVKAEFAEELRALLFPYPVEQGDPGAVTRFAQCRSYSFTKTVDCYLAIQLNYEGP